MKDTSLSRETPLEMCTFAVLELAPSRYKVAGRLDWPHLASATPVPHADMMIVVC